MALIKVLYHSVTSHALLTYKYYIIWLLLLSPKLSLIYVSVLFKEQQTRERKVEVILDSLVQAGPKSSFLLFCYILEVTGQGSIADHLQQTTSASPCK